MDGQEIQYLIALLLARAKCNELGDGTWFGEIPAELEGLPRITATGTSLANCQVALVKAAGSETLRNMWRVARRKSATASVTNYYQHWDNNRIASLGMEGMEDLEGFLFVALAQMTGMLMRHEARLPTKHRDQWQAIHLLGVRCANLLTAAWRLTLDGLYGSVGPLQRGAYECTVAMRYFKVLPLKASEWLGQDRLRLPREMMAQRLRKEKNPYLKVEDGEDDLWNELNRITHPERSSINPDILSRSEREGAQEIGLMGMFDEKSVRTFSDSTCSLATLSLIIFGVTLSEAVGVSVSPYPSVEQLERMWTWFAWSVIPNVSELPFLAEKSAFFMSLK